MHNDKHSVIGKRVANVDGWEKVTGSARYTVDMELPGMLHGKILKKPARAREDRPHRYAAGGAVARSQDCAYGKGYAWPEKRHLAELP